MALVPSAYNSGDTATSGDTTTNTASGARKEAFSDDLKCAFPKI